MAELGLGLGSGEEEESKGDERTARRGKLTSRWGIRRHHRRLRRAREGGNDESAYYSSGHSSVGDDSYHEGSYWFASAPGSFGGRFSFGSELSALSPSPQSSFTNLAGCEPSFLPCQNPEPETRASSTKSYRGLDVVIDEELEQEERTIDPPTNTTVSHSLRDCQNQRVTFESFSSPSEPRRWRPGSLDLNGYGTNAGASSSLHPFTCSAYYTKNSCAPSIQSRSNMLPSPGTPNYFHVNGGISSCQKGWSSERVPLPASRVQRYGGGFAPLFPFNNGRTMPSKWEDAERWICSPVSGDGSKRPVVLPPYHRRPKSKSGPLGAPVLISGSSSHAPASPQIPCFDNGKVVNFEGGSPLLAGVLVTDQQLYGMNGREKLFGFNSEVHIDRAASLDSFVQPSTSLSAEVVFRGYRFNGTRELATMMSPLARSRDVGTQMSPEGSTPSSPKEKPSSLSQSPLFVHTITELQSNFPCLEIRDVQVDDRVTVTRRSKKHISRCSDKRSTDTLEWKKKRLENRMADWEVIGTERRISKFDREEAKIAAWENLQKAKAEAALQKLEMKLEKKRCSSMEKILSRLRSAQKRAQNMRSSVVAQQVCMAPKTGRSVSYFQKYRRMSSFQGCFTCQGF
ncbi:uncharacterized protein LOC110029536 isoform X2 [Phalaenopsis equestris]|uniref:uncharacterized protein LOC110029536 isoform X2 n=1 Tax=Phalaenopsis equestris TaxID=78828 RepID=UPI0009E1B740|nr:uncharacterized protein LOC110029536 isoform X2 [Phalaenopsis equestris]